MSKLSNDRIDWKKNAEHYAPIKMAAICFATSDERYENEFTKVFKYVRDLNYSVPLWYYDELNDNFTYIGKIISFKAFSHRGFPEFIDYIKNIDMDPETSTIITMETIIDSAAVDIEEIADYNRLHKECHIYPKNGKEITFYYTDTYTDPYFPYEDKLMLDSENQSSYVHLAAVIITRLLAEK